MSDASEFARHMEAVARLLLGEPNKHLSRPGVELRYGNKGSISIDLKKKTWFEHGTDKGGGTLDLVVHMGKAADRKGAAEWMRDQGFDIGSPPERGSNRAASPDGDGPKMKPVAHWDYVDENGQVLFQVVRLESGLVGKDGKPEKTYRQRKRDKQGGWEWSVKGSRNVPYRLPELLEDIRDKAKIFIVEGEKSADLLRENGVPATTNARGAGKWAAELTPYFRGAKVIVLRDNDPQATTPDGKLRFHPDGRPVLPGQDHGEAVATALLDVAEEVRILDLPGLPPKGDVVDWWNAGGDIERLYTLAAAAPRHGRLPYRSNYGAVVWGEPRPAVPPYEYLIKGLVPRRELVLIYGASQSGKSFFTMDLSMSVAQGINAFGRRSRQGLVVYCAAEAGVGFANLRMPGYALHNGIEADVRLPFVCLTRKFDLFGNEEEVSKLIAEIQHWAGTFDVPLEAVVIDTLNKTTPGMDEIHGKDVGIVLQRLDAIREACQSGLWLVHHKNASGTGPRGHTSLFAAFETAIEVSRMTEKDAEGRLIRVAKVAKQREGDDGASFRFVLRQVEVGVDADGDPTTTCVVTLPAGTDGQPASAVGYRPSPGDTLFLRALAAALETKGIATPPDLGIPPSIVRVVDYEHVKRVFGEMNPDDGDDTPKWVERLRKALRRARERLYGFKIIGAANPYIWLTGRPVRGFGLGQSGVDAPPPQPAETAVVEDDDSDGWDKAWQ